MDRSIRKLKEAAEEQRKQQQGLSERKAKREMLLRRFDVENDAEMVEETDRRYKRATPDAFKCSNVEQCNKIFSGIEEELSISKEFEIEFELQPAQNGIDKFRFFFYVFKRVITFS